MSLNAQITLSVLAHETSAAGLSSSLRATPVSYSASLSDGIGAGKAQVVWSASRTILGGSETLNLASLQDSRGGAQAAVSVTAVKAIYVRNTHASAAITLSGGPFPAGGTTVAAGGVYFQSDSTAAGLPAGSVAVSGSSYEIVIIGEGTVA